MNSGLSRSEDMSGSFLIQPKFKWPLAIACRNSSSAVRLAQPCVQARAVVEHHRIVWADLECVGITETALLCGFVDQRADTARKLVASESRQHAREPEWPALAG
ncbi:MAG TPA: hypothetical protein VN325_09525, partial [Steroidobacteraceae bacterium]|nr:hypothetical protein [Steroidobacteraceae bacterium]